MGLGNEYRFMRLFSNNGKQTFEHFCAWPCSGGVAVTIYWSRSSDPHRNL